MSAYEIPYKLTQKVRFCPQCISPVLWRHLGDGIWRWECSANYWHHSTLRHLND
jgi:ribosomal protein S27AE